jgi:hypothetical protein
MQQRQVKGGAVARRSRLITALALSLVMLLTFSSGATAHERSWYDFRGDRAFVGAFWQTAENSNTQFDIVVYEGIFQPHGSRGGSGRQTRSLLSMSLSYVECNNGDLTWTLLHGSRWFDGPAFGDPYRVVIGSPDAPVTVALVGETVDIPGNYCSGSMSPEHRKVAEYEFTGEIIAIPTVSNGKKTRPAGDPIFVGANVRAVADPDPAWSSLEWLVGPDLGTHAEAVRDLIIDRVNKDGVFPHEVDPPG